jgi:HEAT repeat protein
MRALTANIIVALALTNSSATAQNQTQKAWDILRGGANASSVDKRVGSIAALGLIYKNAQAEALANKDLEDPKPEVRAVAAGALGQMGAVGSIPRLKNALKDTDVTVVMASANALHVLKDDDAYEVFYAVLTGERKSGSSLVADQKKMLSDPKKMAQFGFDQAIGFVPYAGMGMGAFKALTKDDESPARAAAARVLAGDPDPKSAEALLSASSDKSWRVRAAALDAIGRRGDPALASKIEPALSDEKDVVRYLAAAAYVRLSDIAATAQQK